MRSIVQTAAIIYAGPLHRVPPLLKFLSYIQNLAKHPIFAPNNQALLRKFSGSGDDRTKRELINKIKLVEYK